jgi:hypothetical protein
MCIGCPIHPFFYMEIKKYLAVYDQLLSFNMVNVETWTSHYQQLNRPSEFCVQLTCPCISLLELIQSLTTCRVNKFRGASLYPNKNALELWFRDLKFYRNKWIFVKTISLLSNTFNGKVSHRIVKMHVYKRVFVKSRIVITRFDCNIPGHESPATLDFSICTLDR